MTKEPPVLKIRTSAAWRRWLERHHGTSRGVWLEFYKKHTGKATFRYPEALDEALCFGWIDSILKRIDEDRYMQKFTPRTNRLNWSQTNLRHMKGLIKAGKMTDAGFRALGVPLADAGATPAPGKARPVSLRRPALVVPDSLQASIDRNPKARAFWRDLAPGYRRRYVGWILDAKKEDTRQRRITEVIAILEAGVKSLLK